MWIIGALVILIILLVIKELIFLAKPKNKKKERYYKKMQELDEELEDYDYLDEITGRDDKPWI
jgi:hypothetical protein